MSFTKKQISNFLNNKILFRFSISDSNLINFEERKEIFTFDEIEKVVKTNFDYWYSISDKAPTNFYSNWKNLNNKINSVRIYLSELKELNIDDINNHISYTLSSSRETIEQEKLVYILSIDSPIDKDLEIRKIKSFIAFYIEQASNNLTEATRNYIYLSKNPSYIGRYFSNSSEYEFYPALYLLRKNFSNIKENVSDFETNIVTPITTKLKEISDESDEQYREITSFVEDKHNKIQQQFEQKVSEFSEFKESLNEWQNEKQSKLNDLE